MYKQRNGHFKIQFDVNHCKDVGQYSQHLANGPNKLERLSLASQSSQVQCTNLAYWAHS
jgi:hypothetical protein